MTDQQKTHDIPIIICWVCCTISDWGLDDIHIFNSPRVPEEFFMSWFSFPTFAATRLRKAQRWTWRQTLDGQMAKQQKPAMLSDSTEFFLHWARWLFIIWINILPVTQYGLKWFLNIPFSTKSHYCYLNLQLRVVIFLSWLSLLPSGSVIPLPERVSLGLKVDLSNLFLQGSLNYPIWGGSNNANLWSFWKIFPFLVHCFGWLHRPFSILRYIQFFLHGNSMGSPKSWKLRSFTPKVRVVSHPPCAVWKSRNFPHWQLMPGWLDTPFNGSTIGWVGQQHLWHVQRAAKRTVWIRVTSHVVNCCVA